MENRACSNATAKLAHRWHRARMIGILLFSTAIFAATAAGAAELSKGRLMAAAPKTLQVARQQCQIQNDNTGDALPPDAFGDPLFKFVTSLNFCPQNSLELRKRLLEAGYTLKPAMVADRGYNNPLPAGSYSFFETVSKPAPAALEDGDWFFGHFQMANNNNSAQTSELVEQQQGSTDNLLLESISWDPTVGYYRFYEIRGTGQGGQFFYRGSSLDIQSDIQNLWRDTDPGQPIFGQSPAKYPARTTTSGPKTAFRLRCSGCHMDGGPIMKELAEPHDSWWRQERPLNFGSLVIQQELKDILKDVIDAETFAGFIKKGVDKLLSSAPYQAARAKYTLQEQLRPLFCEQEVNLESDRRPYPQSPDPATVGPILAPAAFFIDPRLLPDDQKPVTLAGADYTNALNLFESTFLDYQSGQSAGIDADHAFEAPVKGRDDIAVIASLTGPGKLISPDFVTAVLAVDMTRPMFSAKRCGLLTLLPDQASSDWLQKFQDNLKASHSATAQELYLNLTAPDHNAKAQKEAARKIMAAIQASASGSDSAKAVVGLVRYLAQQRLAVFKAQISQHPQGEIFEPSFRVIFPTMQLFGPDQQQLAYGGVPGQFWVDPADGRVKLVAP